MSVSGAGRSARQCMRNEPSQPTKLHAVIPMIPACALTKRKTSTGYLSGRRGTQVWLLSMQICSTEAVESDLYQLSIDSGYLLNRSSFFPAHCVASDTNAARVGAQECFP